MAAVNQQIEINDRTLNLTRLDKKLYLSGFTKAEVIDYYIRVSPYLLPHLKNRPITLKRYPDGVEGFFFYEKNCPSHRPKWLKTAKVPRSEGGAIGNTPVVEIQIGAQRTLEGGRIN